MPSVKPADAAGLILIRDGRPSAEGGSTGDPEVLMGRRHRASGFMPSVYVFPGGRLEASDRRASGFPEALPNLSGGLDAVTQRHLACFARAAIRETYEETGLLLGQPGVALGSGTASKGPPVWQAFTEAGLVPAFSSLTLVARAITPTGSPRRFHTRFFLADGASVQGTVRGDGELEDVRWVPLAEVATLPLPAEVTGLVLREALAHRTLAGGPKQRHPALLRWVGERSCHRIEPWPAGLPETA